METRSGRSAPLGWAAAGLLLGLAIGCGDPVVRDVDRLEQGGETAESARMALVLAKNSAVAPLIRALAQTARPSYVRVEIAEVLYRLYLREADPRILTALLAALDDADPAVRGRVARAIGDLHQRQAVGRLIERLEREDDATVAQELLLAVEIIGTEATGRGMASAPARTDVMTDDEKARFAGRLQQLAVAGVPDTLRGRVLEWLEVLAEEQASWADTRLLAGDPSAAEALLLAGRRLAPDSPNLAYRLGRFCYDTGQRERGLRVLADAGMLLRVPRLRQAPRLDGDLGDAAWQGCTPLRRFYQCLPLMRAWPARGRTEAVVGYLGDRLYVGVRGYDEPGEERVARVVGRDEDVWQDDCVEVFMDADHDYRTYHQIVVNSLGSVLDIHYDGSDPAGDRGWDSGCRVAARTDPSGWSLELEIPIASLRAGPAVPGRIWGFNLARVRMQAAEYGQWTPTYGSALRPDRFGFLLFD